MEDSEKYYSGGDKTAEKESMCGTLFPNLEVSLIFTNMPHTIRTIANPLDEKSVSMTLFIPLCPKAMETKRKDPIVIDTKAVEILSRIDMDYKAYVQKRAYHAAIVRTHIIDKSVNEFLASNPDATIINLGCGLDTRISRVNNDKLRWFDVDLPEVIELRKNFFEESDRIRFISKSVLDFSWIDDVKATNPEKVLIIAEGLLCYFSGDEVKLIFNRLIDHFSKATMFLTLVHKFFVGKNITSGVKFKWGLEAVEEILDIDPRMKLLEYWRTSDFFKKRQSLGLRLFSILSGTGKNSNRILKLSFEN
jgi:O-methyltransferase involved in polyketide biosynthesis